MNASPTAERASAVLVVDDDPGVLLFLTRLLNRVLPAGELPPIETAANPAEARCILERLDPEAGPWVVLSDFNMGTPENGIDLLEEIARRQPEARRVLMSGYALSDFGSRIPPGVTYVSKPWSVGELRALMHRLLTGEPPA